MFNVDGGSPLLPIHNHSQTLPMKKARKKKFDQGIRDFENVLVDRYKPALKRSANVLLRTALKLTKGVVKAEGNTESISDNQAMMHLTSLLSVIKALGRIEFNSRTVSRWVAPWLNSCKRNTNETLSFRQVNLLSQKKGGPLFKGARPCHKMMFKPKQW